MWPPGAFYAGTLGLSVLEETVDAVTLRVGATRLTFEEVTERGELVSHIALSRAAVKGHTR